MRRRRILVVVVIFIILNVALAQEEFDLNAESSEDNEQDQTLNIKGDEENGLDDKNKNDPSDIADNDDTNGEDPEPSKGSKPSQTTKPSIVSDNLPSIPSLPHQPQMHLDKAAIIDEVKHKEGCQCNEGLDCKCDNSTSANIDCHCADFDNLAKVNEGYSCKCEKHVSQAVKLKCQCARKDSKVNVVKTITCTSTTTFTQSHIRDITFGVDGKLQLYEKDGRERKVVMTGIKAIKDITDLLNKTKVVHHYADVVIDLRHLKQIDMNELLKYFLLHAEFKLEHFNLCACNSNGEFEVCNCNDKPEIAHSENCICVPKHNKTARVDCMCNEHVLKPKLIYYQNVMEINKCECNKADNMDDSICKCEKEESYAYNYEHIMVDIRAVEKDHILAVSGQLMERVEFQNVEINTCRCTYDKPNWNCECEYTTDIYESQNMLTNCLCAGNHVMDSSECICNSHVLQPSILYNPTKINMYGCVCYNKNPLTEKSSLICDCKQREDNREKYDEVVLDISKIENANMSHVINELSYTVQFYSKDLNYCGCQEDNNLYCNCTVSTKEYTLENPSQCLCMSEKSTNKGVECLCNPHLHDVNIIYASAIKLQECTCSHFLRSSTSAVCKCQNKPSYTYDYNNALVDIVGWSKYSLATILVQLIHIVEYRREHFNLCACSKTDHGKLNCDCHDATTLHTISNCLCTTYGNNKYCMCSPNAHHFGIRYRQTDNNYIEVCTCDKGEKQKSLTCGGCHTKQSVNVFSDKPFNGEIKIPDNTENQFSIIINIILDKFARHDREINKCQCSEDLNDCTCEQNLKPYASPGGELRCLCIADYYYIERPLRCACNPHILAPDLKFNDRMFDIRYCYAFAKRGNKEKTHCVLQKAVAQYNYVIDITTTGAVHANTIKEYIIQARREYNEEKFNFCNCKVIGTSFNCKCHKNTEVYTESSRASCQCILHGAGRGVECICSPHILQFDLFLHARQLDIDGCRCYRRKDTREKDLICEECIRRTPIEKHPRWTINTTYHKKSVEIPINTENQLDVIISFVLSIFQLNDRTFNHCECTNNFEDCTCRHPVGPYILNGEKLHCLCLTDFYYNDKPMQCACNPHILKPKLTYPATKFHIRRVHCSVTIGSNNSVICIPIDTGLLLHTADRVVINVAKSLVIHTKNIFEYIVTHPDYQHEKFTFCTCTNKNNFECNCDTDTKIYNINHQRNCLCVTPNDENQKVECLCNSIVLQFGITFNLTTSNLQACHCYHSVHSDDNNQLLCTSCVKRESYEMHPHFGYEKNYTSIVKINSDVDNQITTIIALVVKQFSISDRVVNYCNCKENLVDCKCEYPVTPYLLQNSKELNCFCVADYYYTNYPVRCGCNPYILQPKINYDKIKYDFRFVTCALSDNSQLICQQRNPATDSGLVNKMVVEITELHIAHITQLVEIILKNKGVTGKHINVCGCEDNDDYLSCTCKDPTHDLKITHSGSCLCLGSASSQNKWNCICNPHILQLGLIFDSKLHLQGCHCYKSIYNQNSTSLTCTQCEKRESFEENPRFDLSVSYYKTINIAKNIESQLIVILNYMFDNLQFPIQNRIVNYCSCTEDLSDLICKCDRPLLPYTAIDKQLHCLCVADYFYADHPVRCACNPYVTQPKIICNKNLFDLRYIVCEVSAAKDKNNVRCVHNKNIKPSSNAEDKVVVTIKSEVLVNIVVIMQFILRRVEYIEEKFNLCSCPNDGNYNCSCDSVTETCTQASKCSCLCVIPRAHAQDEMVECMCNPRVLQFGIQFNSTINHLEGCRCYQVVSENGKSIKCDNCERRISYEHQLRFTTERDYYSNREIKIPPNVENQIELIYRLIVQGFNSSDQIVNFCSCSEKLVDCRCENPMLDYRGHDGLLPCFCVADYFYDDHPLRCACNPLILQPQLVYNTTKYDFRFLHCLNKDPKGLVVQCNFLSHGQTDPTHPLDRAVVTVKTPLRNHFADILEYIQSYKIYSLDVINLCEDCKLLNGQIVCNCRQNTENHIMQQTASCLCLSTLGSAPECMCGPQILQIGIVFHDITVEACRCYHSPEDKTNLNSLVCRECHKRQLFEYNPIFSSNENYLVGSHIKDNVQNQIEYIYALVVKNFTKNDQIVNMCQCLPDLKTCNCKNSVEPYLVKDSMPCLCISDYYYTEYPYQCACNPFILEPGMKWDNKKLEIRHLDCKMKVNSTKLVSCTERPDGPKPTSAEYTFVMRLRNIEVTTEIIRQYLLQNELYKKEPLISCDCKSEQGKHSCKCADITTIYNIHNKGYCLCIKHRTKNQESTECLCNPRILQFGLVFNSESNLLEGCKCYHSLNSNDEYSLICGECHERKSFEFNPHFDKAHNYTDKQIHIERFTEHQIHGIVQVIYKHFNSSDQFVNHCDCTEDMQQCTCDYPIAAYVQRNGKMPCFCVADYYYVSHPVRCACNPFMLQPDYEYEEEKYDIRLAECTQVKESDKAVNCALVRPSKPIPTMVLDTTVWREIQIKIIEEYIISYPQYRDERFNRCGCNWNEVNNEFTCDCGEDTSSYTIDNMCSCLCIVLPDTKDSLGCTCNARILQIGYYYKPTSDFYGCRCYHSKATNTPNSLVCHSCEKILSNEQHPHFKLTSNYTSLVKNISTVVMQNQIEIIIPEIITVIPDHPHRLINYCNCRDDFSNCSCKVPIPPYMINSQLPCLCIIDYYYSDFNLRCGCNPFILQPRIIYDTSRYHFKKLNCRLGKDQYKMEDCIQVHEETQLSIDQIIVDISSDRDVTIQTIITYIIYHTQYKDEHFNKCTCQRIASSSLSCNCNEPTVVCTVRDTCNCLCLGSHNKLTDIECMCNPLSLQFGIIFNGKHFTLEACRFYHPLRDQNSKSLISHDCVARKSFDIDPHFNTDYVYKVTKIIEIQSTTENQLTSVLNIIQQYLKIRDRVFNRCECTENLSACKCKHALRPYLQKNHKMPCFCIADYFYSDLPVQCGCNPFMLQVTTETLKFKESKFDFRLLECFEDGNSVSCTLVKHKEKGPPSADKVVFDMTRLVQVNIQTVMEHILSYTQYFKEHFNDCKCNMVDNKLICTCENDTTSYNIEKRCSCLCYKFSNNADTICTCNPHILQLGIVFNSKIVEITACRCYHSLDQTNNLVLTCDDCRKRESFEVIPRFNKDKKYNYEVIMSDLVENILTNILAVTLIKMDFNDRIVNYCDCSENGKNCRCTYPIEPFIGDVPHTMPCFCISDYYYLSHPLRCACNPFITQQIIKYNSRIYDFRSGNCTAYQGNKENVTCSLVSMGEGTQYPEYKYVIKIRDLNIVNLGIIKEFLIKSIEFKHEEFNDCTCDSELLCTCNKITNMFNVHNKANCLCHKPSHSGEMCICNPRILQIGIVFKHEQVNLLGCRCYHPLNSKNANTLRCDDCVRRESFEGNPRFSLEVTYVGKRVEIGSHIENQIDKIFKHIITNLEEEHQTVNNCECTGNLLECKCDFRTEPYSQINKKMPCFCITDYYYRTHPVRCRCNPYVLQLHYIYDATVYDFIYADCVSENNDKDRVKCESRPGSAIESIDQIVLDMTDIVVVHMTTIIEYMFSFPEFRNEPFNVCTCKRYGNDELKCDTCRNDTSKLGIHNMQSCMCFTDYTKEQAHPECICNAHVLQIGIIYDIKKISWEGCRCYNSGSGDKSLHCVQCHRIVSLVDEPRFKLTTNYTLKANPVVIPTVTENQLTIIRRYIIEVLKKEDRFTNECSCTEDFTDCQCRNKIQFYLQLNTKMPCFCIADYFYNARPMQCMCNPFVLQLTYKYDVTRFDFKYVECKTREKDNVTFCEVHKPTIPQPRPPADLVVMDISHMKVIDIKHIIEYIWLYPQYHDHISTCKCIKNESRWDCDCSEVTTHVTIQNRLSCLCFATSINETKCICSPRILQLGIIFDSKVHSILGCRCYHSVHNYETKTLICDDCKPRVSFDHRPRFNLNQTEAYTVTLLNTAENILVNVLNVTLSKMEFNNRLVDHCKCTEDLKDCSCKYPIGPYSVNNVLPCICIADYYHTSYPIRCGCNPFVLQPKLNYAKRLYDIRHVHCSIHPRDSTKVVCEKADTSPEPHNPEFKQVLRLRNVVVTTTEIRKLLMGNVALKDEHYNLCKCSFIEGIQTCECNDLTNQFTLHHQANCLCVYEGVNVNCICNPRILQIGSIFDSSTVLKGCRCYHPSADDNRHSLICGDCKRRVTFEMNPRFDRTTNYTSITVTIPSSVTLEMDVIYTYLIKDFKERDKIVNHCECHSDFKHCKCDYSPEPYSRLEDLKMPCVCMKDYIGLYSVRCACNPFMMQPKLILDGFKLSHAECISHSSCRYNVDCTQIDIEGRPPKWTGIVIKLHGKVLIEVIIEHLRMYSVEKNDHFNLCTCTPVSENNKIEDGLICKKCTDGAELYTASKNTSCLCTSGSEDNKNSPFECMCNRHVLQFTIVYDIKYSKLLGCECYYSTNENKLICAKCKIKPSTAAVPPFSNTNYTGKEVHIPLKAGVDVSIIGQIIASYFTVSDQFINYCHCTKDLETCSCDYSADSYARSDGKMYCVCTDDYYYIHSTKRCACNPFIWQPTYYYNPKKLNLLYMTCISHLYGVLDCTARDDTQPKTELVLYDAKKILQIDMNKIIAYVLEFQQYRDEAITVCSCDLKGQSYFCTGCSSDTVQYTIANTTNCLCRKSQVKPTAECVCNPFILQSEFLFDSKVNELTGCRCYHDTKDNSKDTMTCYQCIPRKTYEKHPRFDLTRSYSNVSVNILKETENNILIFLKFLVSKFKIEDQVVNYCKCTEDSEDCKCENPIEPYLSKSDKSEELKMNCFCISDYFYNDHPIRCVCNPFILQPITHFINNVHDVRRSYCNQNKGGGVSCKTVLNEGNNPLYRFAIQLRTLHVVNIGIIKEYLLRSEEYVDEPLNSCDCTYNNDNFECNACSKPTDMYPKNNKCNCLCVMPVDITNTSKVECLCGPHILQFGIVYNSEKTDMKGCRCYNKDGEDTLFCNDCEEKVSLELNPQFDLTVSYSDLDVKIEQVESQIDIILDIITNKFKQKHKVVNLCECTEDYMNCKCDYPIGPYIVDKNLDCICVLDHYFLDYPVRCGCNPYILQPKLTYDKEEYLLRFVTCSHNGNEDNNDITCKLNARNVNLNYPHGIILNLRGTIEKHINTILEYIFAYVEHQREKFNICKCNKKNGDLYCKCEKDIDTTSVMHNCLCLLSDSTASSCMCNPHVQQFGLAFNSSFITLESCRCYHRSAIDPNLKSLVCHECHNRDSISEHARFNYNHNYSNITVQNINHMEVHIESIVEVIVRDFYASDQIVNYCKCKGNSHICTCEYPITNYLLPNGELNCVCIDDFYDISYPVRCGCNPFVTHPTSHYNINQFSNKSNYFNFRQRVCVPIGNDYSVNCTSNSYDHPLNADVVHLKHLKHINIDIIRKYFLMSREAEKYNSCHCKYEENGKLVCNCNDVNTKCSIRNPCNCFCIVKNNIPNCLCNPRVLQFGLSFKPDVEFLGCRCYHSRFDKKSSNKLQCNECLRRTSIERAPRFDIDISYRHISITIPATLEKNTDSLITHIISRFEEVYRQVLSCKCKSDLNCECDYPYSLYAFDGMLNCLCMADKSDKIHSLRCGCNPYILHPSLSLANWHNIDVTRLICSSPNRENTTVHCEGKRQSSFDGLVVIPAVPVIHGSLLLQIISKKEEFRNEPFTLCNCQQAVGKTLDCNCQNNTLAYTLENKYNCLCVHNLKSVLYRPVIECLCNAHIHQSRISFDEHMAMMDKCSCYNDRRYDSFLACECEKASSYKGTYHNNYGHVTIDVPQVSSETTSQKRLEQVRDVIIEKFAPEDKDYSNCRCMENMEKCTCAKSIQEYSYKTVTPCVCIPDHLNKTYPMACVCNRHLQQPKLKFDSHLYDLSDCDCFQHHGDMTNVTCHCNKKQSYQSMESTHNYNSTIIEIPSTTEKRIEYVSQIILKSFAKADQTHNFCFCREKMEECKCIDPIMSYFYYNALPCFCITENLMDYPVRCMCNQYILDPVVKYDEKVFEFHDCYFMLQNGGTIYPRCVKTTNPRTRPEWLTNLGFFANTHLQTKHTTIENRTVMHNYTKTKNNYTITKTVKHVSKTVKTHKMPIK